MTMLRTWWDGWILIKKHKITWQCFLLVSSYLRPRKFGKIDWRNIESAAIRMSARTSFNFNGLFFSLISMITLSM
jgi:hypothetical protein